MNNPNIFFFSNVHNFVSYITFTNSWSDRCDRT